MSYADIVLDRILASEAKSEGEVPGSHRGKSRAARSAPQGVVSRRQEPGRGRRASGERDWGRLVGLGLLVTALYGLLFVEERVVLEYSTRGGFYTIVPILIAFTFSAAHGSFTAAFWRSLGIRGKSSVA
ncbi:MAG: hypothetical protein HQL57_08115 [Magnetococcales bacterium]|nr:hypothetical protein [Magnetococcales bacterium]MBF0157132.1 hypothetical protein [Magnetococcales bacterium]